MQGLGGSHVDSVSKGGDHQTTTVAQVLVGIVEHGITNVNTGIALERGIGVAIGVYFEVTLKLTLPLELLHLTDILLDETVIDISGVGVHGNEHHDLLADTPVQLALDHLNETSKTLITLCLVPLQGI